MNLLPGQQVRLEGDETCEVHPDRLGVAKVVTEADSMGVETEAMCSECWEKYRLTPQEEHIGTCEWCKTEEVALYPVRDIDEGFSGPVYDVCAHCRKKQNDDATAELAQAEDDEEYLPPELDDPDQSVDDDRVFDDNDENN